MEWMWFFMGTLRQECTFKYRNIYFSHVIILFTMLEMHSISQWVKPLYFHLFFVFLWELIILPCVLVNIDGVWIGNWFIGHLLLETTNQYNTLAGFHTTDHATLSVPCLFLVVFSVQFLAMDFSQCYCNYKYHCTTAPITSLNHTPSLLGMVSFLLHHRRLRTPWILIYSDCLQLN